MDNSTITEYLNETQSIDYMNPIIQEKVRELKFGLSPEDFTLPEVQGIVSRSEKLPMIRQFVDNIRKEGIIIWEKN